MNNSQEELFEDLNDALLEHDFEMIDELFERYPHICNEISPEGQPFGFVVIEQGTWESVEYVIDKGCDINFASKEGETMLQHAVLWGNVEIVDLLLEKGADPISRDHQGNNILHYSIRHFRGEEDTIQRLKPYGQLLHAKNHQGETPADLANQLGYNQLLSYF